MRNSDICVVIIVCFCLAVPVCCRIRFWRAYLIERWNHFQNRRDLGPYHQPGMDVRLGLVRNILDEASRRAMRLRPGADDYYVVLIVEEPASRLPSVWARIKITAKSIDIALEYAIGCRREDRKSVDDFELMFIKEKMQIASTRCAPRPAEYEFLPRIS